MYKVLPRVSLYCEEYLFAGVLRFLEYFVLYDVLIQVGSTVYEVVFQFQFKMVQNDIG